MLRRPPRLRPPGRSARFLVMRGLLARIERRIAVVRPGRLDWRWRSDMKLASSSSWPSLAAGCGNDPSPPPRFFFTCGDPVCRGYVRPENLPPCSAAQQAGQMCGIEGETCDPVRRLQPPPACAAARIPTLQPGGCPISLAAWKKDIRYLDQAERQRQHDAVRADAAGDLALSNGGSGRARRASGSSSTTSAPLRASTVRDSAWTSTGTRAWPWPRCRCRRRRSKRSAPRSRCCGGEVDRLAGARRERE